MPSKLNEEIVISLLITIIKFLPALPYITNTVIIKTIGGIVAIAARVTTIALGIINIIGGVVVITTGIVTTNSVLEGVIRFYYLIVVTIGTRLTYIKSKYKSYKTYRCYD